MKKVLRSMFQVHWIPACAGMTDINTLDYPVKPDNDKIFAERFQTVPYWIPDQVGNDKGNPPPSLCDTPK